MKSKNPFHLLIQLIFPSRCVICRALTEGEADLCPDCADKLEKTGSHALQSIPFCDGCYSPYYYREPLRASFHRYKFKGYLQYAHTYGRWMAECLTEQGATQFDFITWAPLSRRRKFQRRYDQAEELALEIGRMLHLPVRPTLHKAHRPPLSRMEGDRSARMAALLGAYSLRRDAVVMGQRVLLVDDIVTSGSTLSECARVLRTAGAHTVTCVTLARRHGPHAAGKKTDDQT